MFLRLEVETSQAKGGPSGGAHLSRIVGMGSGEEGENAAIHMHEIHSAACAELFLSIASQAAA